LAQAERDQLNSQLDLAQARLVDLENLNSTLRGELEEARDRALELSRLQDRAAQQERTHQLARQSLQSVLKSQVQGLRNELQTLRQDVEVQHRTTTGEIEQLMGIEWPAQPSQQSEPEKPHLGELHSRQRPSGEPSGQRDDADYTAAQAEITRLQHAETAGRVQIQQLQTQLTVEGSDGCSTRLRVPCRVQTAMVWSRNQAGETAAAELSASSTSCPATRHSGRGGEASAGVKAHN